MSDRSRIRSLTRATGRKKIETTTCLHFAAPSALQTLPIPADNRLLQPFRLHAERKDGGEEPEEELELRHSSETAPEQ